MTERSLINRETGEILDQPQRMPAGSGALLVSAEYVQQTTKSIALLQEMVQKILVRGRDYGRTPGTASDGLWDPGASLIVGAFNCYFGKRRVLSLIDNEDKISVIVEVPVISRATGQEVGSGVGAASTLETKYRYRWLYPSELEQLGYTKEQILTLKTDKKHEGRYRIDNPEHGELLNTLVKQACLGSTTSVIFRTSKATVRSNISKMFLCFKKGPLWVPTPNGSWARVTAMVRHGGQAVRNIRLLDSSVLRVTPEHRFPTPQGLLPAADLKPGVILMRSDIPAAPETGINPEYGWLVGLFVAEGNYTDNGSDLRFTLNKAETDKAARIATLLTPLGCRVRPRERTESKTMDVNVFGQAASGLMRQFVEGHNCYTKHFSRFVWSQPREFLQSLLNGYLEGDAHLSKRNKRQPQWVLGFTGKNRELADDLRTLSDILGLRLCLKRTYGVGFGKRFPIYHGWISPSERDKYHNWYHPEEVTNIKSESKPAVVYDLEIDDPSHVFLLGNGIQTHNSKRAEVDASEALPGAASALRELLDPKARQTQEPAREPAGAGESNEGPRWQRFWGEVRRLGYTQVEAYAKLQVPGMKEWMANGHSLDEALKLLREEKVETAQPPAEDLQNDRAYNKQMIQAAAGRLKWDAKRLTKEIKDRTGVTSLDEVTDDKLQQLASVLTDMAEVA